MAALDSYKLSDDEDDTKRPDMGHTDVGLGHAPMDVDDEQPRRGGRRHRGKKMTHEERLAHRQEKAKLREEKRQSRIAKKAEREEAKRLKRELREARRAKKDAQKAEFKAAKANLKNIEVDASPLEAFLAGGASAVDMDVSVPKLADIPSVKYDQAEGPEGPDTFARHHAPVMAFKEQIKALKLRQKEAKRSGDVEAFKAVIAEREELQRQMAEAEIKAVITTLHEKHSDKNLDEVLDLHGLRGKEAKLVIERQIPAVEKKVDAGELAANTESGYVYCVVTGKGLHGTRCVLKPLVERFLIKEGYTYAELDNGAGYKVLFE